MREGEPQSINPKLGGGQGDGGGRGGHTSNHNNIQRGGEWEGTDSAITLVGKGEQTALMAMETKSHENSRAGNPGRKGKREGTDSAIALRGDGEGNNSPTGSKDKRGRGMKGILRNIQAVFQRRYYIT
jgi:hypothetical protein